MLERGFLIFWICLLFFSEFSCPGRVWTEFGTKIFLFLCLFQPVFDRNNAGINFFNFLNFFATFFTIFFPGRVWTEFGTKFFFPFFGISHPILAKNNAGKRFFNFFNFLLFFSEFSFRSRLWTKFGTIIFFFSLSRPISSRFC